MSYIRFTAWISPKQKKRLERMSKKRMDIGLKDTSVTAIVRQAIDRFIAEETE